MDQSSPKEKLSNSEFFNTLILKEKVSFILYDYPNSTRLEISNMLIPCHPVTIVTPVTSVTPKNEGNNSDKGDRSDKVTTLCNNLKNILKREIDNHNTISVNKSGKLYAYSLTEKGRNFVLSKWDEFKKNLNEATKRSSRTSFNEKVMELFETYFEQEHSINHLIEAPKSNIFILELDILELLNFDPDIVTWLLDNPTEVLSCAEIVISKISNKEVRIILKNIIRGQTRNITRIRADDINKLISFVGEITSRSKSSVQCATSKFECKSCGGIINITHTDNEFKEPVFCSCGNKRNFKEISSTMDDYLGLTISDLYENLEPGDVPEEINVKVFGDFYEFTKLNPGDRVKIIGIPQLSQVYSNNNKKSATFEKVIECRGIEKVDGRYNRMYLTDEDELSFEEIKKNPLTWHKQLLFSDLEGVDFPETVALISYFGDCNILFVGKPGIGKSLISKRIANTAIKGRFVSCNAGQSSSSGIIGTLSKNHFTGRYSLDGGALRPMHPHGLCVLDEINRDTDYTIQNLIMEVMSDKEFNLAKANNRINVLCNIKVWATLNIKEKDLHKMEYERFRILEALLDRFEMIVYFTNQVNFQDTEKMAQLMEATSNKQDLFIKTLPKDKLVLLRKYYMKAELIDVKLSKDDYHRCAELMKGAHNSLSDSPSFRILPILPKILKGICKIHHRNHTIPSDFIFLSDMLIQLNNSKQSFLQGPKIIEEAVVDNEFINLKCDLCGDTPCVVWDKNGKPLCQSCK